jgi:putative heme-binding domain-containing protein
MRGTIQKCAKTTRKLETTATGIRVPYALNFNRAGDLFVTDQEGETWCPNGNPLDELNHIIAGRNYGFPPRDDKYLPDLVSEPPVAAFGPQHQAACGFVFNEPRKGQGLFGPKWWEGNAFVVGESRGKIWRVELTKSNATYTSKQTIIARLNMLTTDVTISPRGELYVSCHSGLPDWGTGPNGQGKLFKIVYTETDAPQPMKTWLAKSNEVRMQFDRNVSSTLTNGLRGTEIEYGEFVRAGDRFEILKPPYKTVKQQDAAPRAKLKVLAAKLQDKRTLSLTTEPHQFAAAYALRVPSAGVEVDYEARAGLAPMPRAPSISDSFEIVGGDVKRGKDLFFSEQLKCGTCHRIHGEGGTTAPDLSNLQHRDAASILRDIKDPNATINPDYVAYNISLNNEEEIIGFIKSQSSSKLHVVRADAQEVTVLPVDVKEMRPSPLSLMPAGLLDGLKAEQTRDLLAFLVAEAPKPPSPPKPSPPQRTKAEVEAVLGNSKDLDSETLQPLNIVLIASKQDHGPGEHDYPTWQTNWSRLMSKAPKVTVTNAWQWPTSEQFSNAHAFVFYFWNHSWTPERYKQIEAFLNRGGALVMLHSASIADKEPEALADWIGLAFQPVRTKYRHGELDLKVAKDHPITRGLPPQMHFLDETYWPMIGDTNKVDVLATAEEEGKWWPMIWTMEKGNGRVFGSILGHYTWTYKDPFFRVMILRGLAWATHQPINRFESLVLAE